MSNWSQLYYVYPELNEPFFLFRDYGFFCQFALLVTSKRNEMERLHPPSHKATVDKQVRLLDFGEDVPASLHYAVARKKNFGFE